MKNSYTLQHHTSWGCVITSFKPCLRKVKLLYRMLKMALLQPFVSEPADGSPAGAATVSSRTARVVGLQARRSRTCHKRYQGIRHKQCFRVDGHPCWTAIEIPSTCHPCSFSPTVADKLLVPSNLTRMNRNTQRWWCFLLLTTSFCTSSRHWKRTGFQSITGKGPSPLLVGKETGQLRVIRKNLQLALLSQSPRPRPEFFTPHLLELLMNLSFLLRAHVIVNGKGSV